MHKDMPFSIFAVCFSVGVISHRFLPTLFPVTASILLGLSGILWLLLYPKNSLTRLIVVFTIGLLWANFIATKVISESLHPSLEKQDLIIVGKIVGIPKHAERYTSFDFQIDHLYHENKEYPSPGKVKLSYYSSDIRFAPSQLWTLSVRLKQPRGLQNPGQAFDYEAWLFERRIRATGYIRKSPLNILNDNDNDNKASFISLDKSRQNLASHLATQFPENPFVGILTALLVGVKHDISSAQWEVFQKTGTIHLVAISGLHIGLVASLIFALVSFILRNSAMTLVRIPIPIIAVVAGVLVAFGYALMAGMTIPTRRAFIMVAAFAIAMISRRCTKPHQSMCIALGCVLLVDPLAPLSKGFWLSFWAVSIIVFCVSRLPKRPTDTREISYGYGRAAWAHTAKIVLHHIKSMVKIQLILTAGMLPLLILVFPEISVVSPLANLIAIPLVSLVTVPISLLGLCLYFSGFEEGSIYLFWTALQSLKVLWLFLTPLAENNLSTWHPGRLPLMICIGFGLGCLLWAAMKALPGRVLTLGLIAPVFFFIEPKHDRGEFSYHLLDVGHGLASIIQTANHVLIFDAGPAPPLSRDMGKSVVLPYLDFLAVNTIDRIIISHYHLDHYGGFATVKAQFPAASVFSGAAHKFPGATQCIAGDTWNWDGVIFEFLWPDLDLAGSDSGNNISCALKVTAKAGSILLTGDIESQAEHNLVRNQAKKLASNVLQVPHQGSKTSSTIAFLNAVKPDIAVMSVGYLNRFRHPHSIVVNRYAEREIKTFRTDHSGAMTVKFGKQIELTETRKKLTGYWYNEL